MKQNLLQGIDTVIVRVSNIESARSWYAEKLGLKAVHEDQILKLVVMDTHSPTSLTLWETGERIEPNPRAASYPIFRSPDAASAQKELSARGVKVGEVVTDHVVTYFTFFDPDGNILEACQVH